MILQPYPIGVQTFEKIRKDNCLYIDKTQYIRQMMEDNLYYVFLARPRRFGKSLFTSTLEAYFEGKKELFEGLEISKWEKEWKKYPVIHLDMSTAKSLNEQELGYELNKKLTIYERIYGRDEIDIDYKQRLEGLITRAYEQTGKEVVVLIDEYDAPLLKTAHDSNGFNSIRNIMRNFYSPLKSCDKYLKFVYITGITKFSQLSIFSELNNLNNISMDEKYAAICGITQEELETQMSEHIDFFAKSKNESRESIIEKLKHNYDGYHFTWPSADIYNPFSLMNSFQKQNFSQYWFESGTPSVLLNILPQYEVKPTDIGEIRLSLDDFNVALENAESYHPLLYQSGYLTIKDYVKELEEYVLDIPNKEVRIGLIKSLVSSYISVGKLATNNIVRKMSACLMNEDIDGMLKLVQNFLLTVPRCNNTKYEGHWQQVLYIIFSMLGELVEVEVRTSTGQIDMVMYGKKANYIFEIKLDSSAESAINQIESKQYGDRFALSNLPLVKVGINFDSKRNTIEEWTIK